MLEQTLGARPPVIPPPAARRGEERERGRGGVPVRGAMAAGEGWTGLAAPHAVYRATTAQAAGVYPLIAASGVPPVGAYIGPDLLSGGAFYAHPVEWLRRGLVTNPNLIIFGEPGRGKSGIVKTLVWRLSAFGVRTLIAGDTKDEYEPLARAMGCEPIALGLGMPAKLNPLDAGPLGELAGVDPATARERAAEVERRRLVLMRGLLAARGYTCTTTDDMAIAEALRTLTGQRDGADALATPTIPQLWAALAYPDADLVAALRCRDPGQLNDLIRPMVDALGALVAGSLGGLFDEPTNITVDFRAPIQSLSLSRLSGRGEEAIAVALTCLSAWSQAAVDLRRTGEITMVVRDEMWRVMRLGDAMVKAVDSALRLSRSEQAIQVLAAHKPSDMLSVGATGSQAVNIAKDLLALCDTRILLGQSSGVAGELADALGLSDVEQDLLTGWANGARGRALWKVGGHGFKVRAWWTADEAALYDTDVQMTGGGSSSIASAAPSRVSAVAR